LSWPEALLFSTSASVNARGEGGAATTRCARTFDSLRYLRRDSPDRRAVTTSCGPPNANMMQTSTPSSAQPAPTAPPRFTAMPSDLSQHPDAVDSPNSACRRALQTTELLENILVHLPVKDLFVHQRVSKRFQATIAESLAIQRKMFLRLSSTPREYWKYVC
jgi:hypothetical protein